MNTVDRQPSHIGHSTRGTEGRAIGEQQAERQRDKGTRQGEAGQIPHGT